MRTSVLLAIFPLTALLAGAACPPEVEETPEPVPVVKPPPKKVEPPPLPPVSREGDFLTAVNLLDRDGDPALAKRHLQREIEALPERKTRRTRRLLEEIDADPEPYFAQKYGRGSFKYRVQQGDQLSTIANRFLGSPYSFYILGRYNGLNQVNLVEVGQTLKIPGRSRGSAATAGGGTDTGAVTQPVAPPPPPPDPDPPPPPPPPPSGNPAVGAREKARDLIGQNDYRGAIAELEPYKDAPGNRGMLVDLYLETARRAEAGGQLEEAQGDLRKAQALAPSNPTVSDRIAAIDGKLRIESLMRSADAAQNRDEPDEAIGLYRQVLDINPNHAQARQQERTLTSKRIQYWERQALTAQNKQELQKAIDAWGEVLELDPNNRRAQLKREEVRDLKERAEGIPQAETTN